MSMGLGREDDGNPLKVVDLSLCIHAGMLGLVNEG